MKQHLKVLKHLLISTKNMISYKDNFDYLFCFYNLYDVMEILEEINLNNFSTEIKDFIKNLKYIHNNTDLEWKEVFSLTENVEKIDKFIIDIVDMIFWCEFGG